MKDLYYEPAIATFELPLPPGINASYEIGRSRKTGKARFVSTEELQQFKDDAALLLKNQLQLLSIDTIKAYTRTMGQIRKYGLFIFIDVLFFIEDILKRDEDGGLKAVQDVVCDVLDINDKYVLDAHPGKRRAHGNPRCEVSVYLAVQENAA
jgi:Holliday junction resolvase RusA-like endonuclease